MTERLCKYKLCREPLPAGKRRNAEYCNSTCRAEASHLRHGTRDTGDKALQSAATNGRRATRDGVGTRIYNLGKEIDYALAALRGEKRPRLTSIERAQYEAKLIRGRERCVA